MDKKENKSKFKREIERLSSVSIRGKLFEETTDTIVIQMNNSLLEMNQEDIMNVSKIQSDQEANLVSVTINGAAKITKRTLVNAGQAMMEWTDDGSRGDLGKELIIPGGIAVIHVPADTGLGSATVVIVSPGGSIPTPYARASVLYAAAKIVGNEATGNTI